MRLTSTNNSAVEIPLVAPYVLLSLLSNLS